MKESTKDRKPGAARTIALFAAVAVLFGGIGLLIAKPWDREVPVRTEQIGAKLELAAGEVLLHAPDADPVRLLSGTPLPDDAAVETRAGARALVRMGDGTRVFLREQSRIQLGVGIELEAGEVWLEVPPLDRGREPVAHRAGSASVALSDAGANLALREGVASVYVAEGLAVMRSGAGRAEVKAGERGRVEGDAAPAVESVAFWDDWTGGMADRAGGRSVGGGSGTLYAVDRQARPGSPALPLTISRQSVQVAIEHAVAETRVDQRFFNPSDRDVEGWYWFTVPEGAQLVSFALETDGVLIEGEVVERKQAAETYERAVRRSQDPALLEWIDDRTVRARIFPVPSLGERRIVVRYQQLLSEIEGKLRYSYPLAAAGGRDAPTIEEFSLEVALEGELSARYDLATLDEARVEDGGRRVTMRRSGYTPRADFELELSRKEGAAPVPVRLNELELGEDQARFVMVRYAPELDFSGVEMPSGDVVVVVDTSAAGDPAEHHTKLAVAEALLRSLSEGDRFAVMNADLTASVLHPEKGLAEASSDEVSSALQRLDAHRPGGATDLGGIFERALERVHDLEQPAIVYIGDGMVTSGERDGDALAGRLRRSMTGSRARLFTIGVGSEVDEAMLGRLARVGGGDYLRVELPEQAVVRALELSGALKTPTITDLEIDLGEGLDDVFYNVSGKLSRGQELVMLARTHHDLPERVVVRGRIAGEDFETEHPIERDKTLLDQIVPRLWAAAYIERLLGDTRGPEAVRGKVLSLGLEYGLMTPFTSFLALDSERAYAQQGIERRRRPFGLRMTADARFMRGDVAEPGVGAAILGAASAPFGCGASGEAPQAASDDRGPPEVTRADPKERPAETPPPPPGAREAKADNGMEEDAEAERSVEEALPAAAPAPEPADEPEPIADGTLDGDAVPRRASTKAKKASKSGFGGGLRGSGGKGEAQPTSFAKPEADPPAAEPESKVPSTGRQRGKDTLEDSLGAEKAERGRPVEPIASGVPRYQKLPCTDASSRGLAHRRILWKQRLARTNDMVGALRVFEASAGGCEIKSWRDERVFLQLLQLRAATEHDISTLLAHFGGEPDARDYLARGLLRRLVDPGLVAAVENAMFGRQVDWDEVDRAMLLETDDEKRFDILRKAIARAPEDPQGQRRLLERLVERGKIEDAIARGRKMRQTGVMTPALAQQLGELFVRHGQDEEAKRLFSEIVEFDPHGAGSRRLLGDIFLRHGWYEQAYRQYQDLLGLAPNDATASMRLARAAAGSGRVDEGLRILRKVSSGEGRPGADDPRRWARLIAAAYLAVLLDEDDSAVPVTSVTRELKRLQLFEGPTTWSLLVWEDLDARLVLALAGGTDGGKKATAEDQPILPPDAVDAGAVGLFALQEPPAGAEPLRVRHRGPRLDREVRYQRILIRFDGSRFEVEREAGAIEASQPDDRVAVAVDGADRNEG